MKKTLFITIFLCLVAVVVAQKPQRRIYLWDVTLSMKGYKGQTPDIYDDVVKFLVQEVESITDQSAEIFVLPFQEKILEEWRAKADVTGKDYLIDKIKNYNNNISTYTNIVGPIKDVMSNYLSAERDNTLMLLTDGLNSKQFGGTNELIKQIQEWGNKYKQHYWQYVMLTQAATNIDVRNAINQCQNIDIIEDNIVIQPENSLCVNLTNDGDKPVEIKLKTKGNNKIPDNLIIRVETVENSYVSVNEACKVENDMISFNLEYIPSLQHLCNTLPLETQISLRLILENSKEMLQQSYKMVTINPDEIELKMVNNRKERVLKFYYEN